MQDNVFKCGQFAFDVDSIGFNQIQVKNVPLLQNHHVIRSTIHCSDDSDPMNSFEQEVEVVVDL